MSKIDFDFERLIQPLDTATFLREYWEQKPLILARGKSDYYLNLVSIKEIDSIIGFSGLKYSDFRLVKIEEKSLSQNKVARQASYIDSNAAPNINELYNAYYQGNSLCLQEIHQRSLPIATLCKNLEIFFNHPVHINMYLTPKNSQGFPPHFDTHDVFILQIEGSKLWRIYDCFLELPLVENRQPVPKETLNAPSHEFVLNAGDLLYIPRGYIHEAQTSENSSLHLTVGVSVFRWSELIVHALASATEENLFFRKALPVGFINRGEMMEFMKNQLAELLEIFANKARIEDAVERITKRFIDTMSPLPDGHFIHLDEVNKIALDTTVAKRKGMICNISKKEDTVIIQFPGNAVTGPGYIAPALSFIAEKEEFTVRSIPSISDNSKLVLVRRLIREGLLTIAKTAN